MLGRESCHIRREGRMEVEVCSLDYWVGTHILGDNFFESIKVVFSDAKEVVESMKPIGKKWKQLEILSKVLEMEYVP
jgi:hypothetical protein